VLITDGAWYTQHIDFMINAEMSGDCSTGKGGQLAETEDMNIKWYMQIMHEELK
jgi:hypothetical protein